MSKKFSLLDNSTVLFQGDSITDSERKNGHNESLGDGYVMMTVAWLSALYPEYHMKFFNRGLVEIELGILRIVGKKIV